MKSLLLLVLAMTLTLGLSAYSDVEIGVQVGQKAPDFTLPQLDGDPITLSEVVAQNDVTLLFFFLAAS